MTFGPIPYFNPWMLASPTLPDIYWKVKSREQLIAQLYCIVDAIKDLDNQQTDEINAHEAEIAELQGLFEKFQQSGFDDYYKAQIEQWIQDNAAIIWDKLAQMVFFGLTDDGHFCAYIPDSWADIQFDTGAVFGTEQYGRLILRYNTDGQGVIDNTSPTYPYSGDDVEELRKQVNQLRHTVYTALTSQG